MKKLYLIRGLSGSGKSTLGEELDWPSPLLSADDYFYDEDGVYNFDPTQLAAAHQECQRRVGECMAGTIHHDSRKEWKLGRGQTSITVANTFSCRWEMQPYFDLAREYDYQVTVIDLFDGGLTDEELADPQRNSHGVPVETIRAMRERWEHDWKSGNPTPPWER